MELFSKDVPAIRVALDEGETGINYEAGALKVSVISATLFLAKKNFFRMNTKRYNWVVTENVGNFQTEDLPFDIQVEYEILNSGDNAFYRIPVVMAACANGPLNPETALSWFLDKREFFDECYEAAIELNPSFATVEEKAEANPDSEEDAALKN